MPRTVRDNDYVSTYSKSSIITVLLYGYYRDLLLYSSIHVWVTLRQGNHNDILKCALRACVLCCDDVQLREPTLSEVGTPARETPFGLDLERRMRAGQEDRDTLPSSITQVGATVCMKALESG